MKCADPTLCYNNGKTKIYRNFSLATPIHKIMSQQIFDCGKCIQCRKKKAQELATRCVLHASLYENNCFLTLTYDETKPSYHNNFNYKDIQNFKKSLRRHCDYHFKKKIQIFNVHEYGKNGKKHWHLVVFNHDFPDRTLHTYKNQLPLYTSKILEKLWPHGFNSIGNVTEASAMYQAQYTQKDLKYGNVADERKSHSKHSGIGRDFFLKHYDQILSLGYIPFSGKKIPIPRYFQKLAHKHYSHFYAQENFFDTPLRKAIHRPFKTDQEPIKKIADLYQSYYKQRQIKILDMEKQWQETIANHIYNDSKPDFKKAAENLEYDLKNKQNNNYF